MSGPLFSAASTMMTRDSPLITSLNIAFTAADLSAVG
jgi:hypothetical protein